MNATPSNIDIHDSFRKDILHRQNLVIRLLEETTEKLMVSVLMPRFLQNVALVRSRLKGTSLEKIAKLLQSYAQDEKAKIKGLHCSDMSPCQHSSLARILDLFHENHEIVKYFPEWLHDLKTNYSISLKQLELIGSIADGNFQQKAKSQMQIENFLHQIWFEHLEVLRCLEIMEHIMQEALSSELSDNKDDTISEFTNILRAQKQQAKILLHQERKQCYRWKLRIPAKIFREEVKERLDNQQARYQKVRQKNLVEERKARNEFNKIQLQYQALLKKYDHTMLEKFRKRIEIDELEAKELKEYERFERYVYKPVERIYVRTVVVRREEDKRKWREKIEEFARSHAARVIQLAFRAYLSRNKIKLRKRKAKAKGKKK